MEDENTQADGPMTQRQIDPRRLGRNNSGLTETDISDVICILHPSSPAAYRIVESTAKLNPQHVLQNRGLIDFGQDGQFGSPATELSTIRLDSSEMEQPQDLALRFSSRVCDPTKGFCFGRNQMKCDINLDADDNQKRVSNMHFRIYVNSSGIIMLEDMSTNGTVVDTVTLGGKRHAVNDKTRMLNTGSVIEILAVTPEDVIKFVLRIPRRDGHTADHHSKLRQYLEHVAIAEERARAANKDGAIPDGAVRGMLAAPLAGPPNTKTIPPVTVPSGYKSNFGIHWDGAGEYNCVGILGKGAFATVYQLATIRDGDLYAGKELEKKRFIKNGVLDYRLDNELSIMKELRHENIVQYIDVKNTAEHLYIIMEFVPCGDLQGYMSSHGTLPEDFAREMTRQILSALAYLHRKGITHRDIKPDNILICSEAPFVVKLTDFGLSKVVKNNDTFLKTFCGTLLYCAPEVFPHYDNYVAGRKPKRRRHGSGSDYRSYSQLVDIWSYAAVLWFVLCGKPPFEGVHDPTGRAMFNKIVETDLDTTPLREKKISEDCIDLLRRMLTVDPTARPTENECLSHPWLNDGVAVPAHSEELYGLGIITEEAEHHADELDASRISIHDQSSDDNANSSVSGDSNANRHAKRAKAYEIDVHREQTEMPSSSENSYHSMIPIINAAAGDNIVQFAPSKPQRLFGEIGDSALRSSGVLGKPVNGSTCSHVASDHKSSVPTANDDAADKITNNYNTPEPQVNALDGAASIQEIPHFATSLYGAESMVRELKMGSPESSTAAFQSLSRPPVEENQSDQVTPRSKQNGAPVKTEDFPQDKTPRQPIFSRQINLGPPTASHYFDPYNPDTHSIDYATRISGINFLADPNASSSNLNIPSLPDTTNPSFSSTNEHTNGNGKENEDPPHEVANKVPLATIDPAADEEFIKPNPPLGHLYATSDSFAHQTITLHNRVTTWGRHPGSTVPYSPPHDTRVPKAGLEIWFHAKGIENAETKGEPDWRKMPDLSAIVRTRSSKGIKVNGVEMKENDNGHALYGHLRTGDEITVYDHGNSKLKFHCEFFVGAAKAVRGPTEKRFEVLKASSSQ